MARIQIAVLDLLRGTKTMMEVPDDVEVGRLVEAMVEHMQLPTTGPNGRSIRYYLSVRQPGGNPTRLETSQTLAENGVQRGDMVQLAVEREYLLIHVTNLEGSKACDLPIETDQTVAFATEIAVRALGLPVGDANGYELRLRLADGSLSELFASDDLIRGTIPVVDRLVLVPAQHAQGKPP